MGFYNWLKPFVLKADPERTHGTAVALGAAVGRLGIPQLLRPSFAVNDRRLATCVAGLSFPSPVGLAAGFDKSGQAVRLLSCIGFGSIEIGSVSEHPSSGNSQRPRIWRLEADEALRVYYGCPNDGAVAVASRLRGLNLSIPLGVNLVETNTGVVTSAEHAAREIVNAVGRFAHIADYIVLNLSCPNMPQGGNGLFDDPGNMNMLLELCGSHRNLPPIFLKLTPPDDPEDPRVIGNILSVVDPYRFVKGFVLNIVNKSPETTLVTSRSDLARTRGGVTGPSLYRPTMAALAAWYARIDRSRHILIGVGGVSSPSDAYQMLRAGASLIQIYTALVYRGPGLVKKINQGILEFLERDGFAQVADIVGVDVRPGGRPLRQESLERVSS